MLSTWIESVGSGRASRGMLPEAELRVTIAAPVSALAVASGAGECVGECAGECAGECVVECVGECVGAAGVSDEQRARAGAALDAAMSVAMRVAEAADSGARAAWVARRAARGVVSEADVDMDELGAVCACLRISPEVERLEARVETRVAAGRHAKAIRKKSRPRPAPPAPPRLVRQRAMAGPARMRALLRVRGRWDKEAAGAWVHGCA